VATDAAVAEAEEVAVSVAATSVTVAEADEPSCEERMGTPSTEAPDPEVKRVVRVVVS